MKEHGCRPVRCGVAGMARSGANAEILRARSRPCHRRCNRAPSPARNHHAERWKPKVRVGTGTDANGQYELADLPAGRYAFSGNAHRAISNRISISQAHSHDIGCSS